MSVSHLTRSRDQLWSDLLVVLGGSEAFLSRSISERRILLEIMETFSVTVSTKDIDDLDELLEQVVIAAGGSASHLRQNKHEMLAALVTALGGTPPSASSSSTGELLAACVNAVDTGGGGGGDWWDATSTIDIDLVNNRAWTEADGEVAIDTLLGSDPNTVNGWGASLYDAGQLTSDGYVGANDALLALLGVARTKVLSGATTVLRSKQPEANDRQNLSFIIMSVDGQDAVEADIASSVSKIDSWNSLFDPVQAGVVENIAVGAINVMACTITDSRAEFAVNGFSPPGASVGTVLNNANPLVAVAIWPGAKLALQSITIYDALPSTAGLSALSETGVTNTAPTAINVTTFAGIWTNVGPSITVTDAQLTTDTSITPVNIGSVIFDATDAEGNPVIFTVVADSTGGKIAVHDGPFLLRVLGALSIADSPITFTLRATDPGGLYVEQEFTITVTA